MTSSLSFIENDHEYVDLGLSVMWATCNVGATNPEEFGDYYAWGETNTKQRFSWNNYRYCSNGESVYDVIYYKYNANSRKGSIDNKSILDPDDDVAHIKWGGNWRMPTTDELKELLDNCVWKRTTLNNVKGFRVFSKVKGYTDRSIFLPLAGWFYGPNLRSVGITGHYLTSSIDPGCPWDVISLYLYYGNHEISLANRTGRGQSVRPVCTLKKNEIKSLTLEDGNNTIELRIHKKFPLKIFGLDNEGRHRVIKIENLCSDKKYLATVDSQGIIIAKDIGICNITGHNNNLGFECKVHIIEKKHDCVDLGLSVKWATCNVGTDFPEERGGYYAWGEIESKHSYGVDNYKFIKKNSLNDNVSITKYNTYETKGPVDNRIELDIDDDVAHYRWGNNWRMPTDDEFRELLEKCTWKYIELNKVNGYLITSNIPGFTNRSIFLPAAGLIIDSSSFYYSTHGYYRSKSIHKNKPICAYSLGFNDNNIAIYPLSRVEGYSVRPVCP